MGDPTAAAVNVTATNAVVSASPNVRSSLASDNAGNIFYARGSALMKIDAQTGYVTLFGGDLQTSGCTWESGRKVSDTGYNLINAPIIAGANPDASALIVASNSCAKVYSVRASDGMVLDTWSLSPGYSTTTFLAGGRYLIYNYWIGSDLRLYRLDVGTSGTTPVRIAGDGTLLASMPSVGAAALSVGGPGASGNWHRIVASPDAKRVYWSGAGDTNFIRYDDADADGVYQVGAIIGSSAVDSTACTGTRFDAKVYCQPRHVGRTISVFDLGTETWGTTRTVPFTNNDNGGFLSLASGNSRLLAHYSLNTINSIDTTNMGSNSAYTVIAGQALSIYGNGSDASQVAFQDVYDFNYHASSKKLHVVNSGHFRVVDMSTGTYNISTLYSGIGSFGKRVGFNRANTSAVGAPDTCGGGLKLFTYSLSTGLQTATPLSSPCSTTTGFPPASLSPASSAGTYIYSGNTSWPGYHYNADSRPLLHSNGKIYFAAWTGTSDIFIFSADGTHLNRVAGKTGAGGYVSSHHGTAALGASLKNVRMMQEMSNGDLLIWDGNLLRRISIGSETAGDPCPNGGVAPCLYDVLDYTLATGFTSGTVFRDAYYDASSEIGGVLGSGTTYYVNGSNVVRKFLPTAVASGAVSAATDTAYTFTGTSLTGEVRIALTPAGLLVLQPSKQRILRVSP